jgi:AcrR family transcriptional regulator
MPVVSEKVETRTLILDAMDSLMARYGYRKTTADDIAREAGISKRTVYLHFTSKEEIALSSIDRVVESAQAQMRVIAGHDSSISDRIVEMLVERVMARIRAVEEYRQSLDELFEAVRPAYMLRRQAQFEEERRILQGVLAKGRSAGEFEFADASETARDLLFATNAYLPYSLSVRELGEPREIQIRLKRLAHILVRGLARGRK